MFRKPYHLCPPKHPEKCGPGSDPDAKIWMNQNSMAGVSLLQFFTEMEWNDWAESVPFLRNKVDEKKGSEEFPISKVSANYTYPNVFGLRRHKLEIMKQIIETVPRNVKFVRLKELERSPELFIQGLVKEFNVSVKEGYKSQPPSNFAHPTVCLTPDEWDAAQSAIDWKLEAEFGFSPCDCRMCYGYEKSKRLYERVQEGKKVKKIVDKNGRSKGDKKKKGASKGMKEQEGKSIGKPTKGQEDKKVGEPTKKQEDKKDGKVRKMQEDKKVGKVRKNKKINKLVKQEDDKVDM